eukprot:jgi/Ulvmu1/3700/UM170_0006.1
MRLFRCSKARPMHLHRYRFVSACSHTASTLSATSVRQASRITSGISNMSRPRFCIVSDLDHTLVDHSDHEFPTLLQFDRLWLSRFAHDSRLVFSTGRSLASYSQLRKTVPLLTPDLLICSVGTEIYQDIDDELTLDSEWLDVLDEGWDRERISSLVSQEFPQLTPQEESEQRPHKVSYHLQKDGLDDEAAFIKGVQDRILGEGLNVKVVYSGGVDVDILPEKASKGLALRFLQSRWETGGQLPSDGIQVNGDSGNDAELFEVPGVYGCIVSNAMPELASWADAHPSDMLFRAVERCTAGVMETMRHFDKVPGDDALPQQACALKALVTLYQAIMDWRNGTVPEDPGALAEIKNRITRSDEHAASEEGLSYTALATESAAAYGSSGESGKELVWLDCPHVAAVEGGHGWRVRYHVCRMRVGEERQADVAHTAVLLPQVDAPEGFAVAVKA